MEKKDSRVFNKTIRVTDDVLRLLKVVSALEGKSAMQVACDILCSGLKGRLSESGFSLDFSSLESEKIK